MYNLLNLEERKMAEKKTYSLLLSYEGSTFCGWHTQINAPTVQGALNEVLSTLYSKKIFAWGAGRTDSGAHALQYRAHYRTHNDCLPKDRIKSILNSKLPPEIRIYDVQEVSNKFHATFGCKARTYCYFIHIGEVLPPRFYKKVFHEWEPLNPKVLKDVLPLFKGTHDFTQFCYGYTAQEKLKKTMIRRVDYFYVKQVGDYLVFFIKGEGFLRGMIRTLIGTSLSVAKGVITIAEIKDSLAGKPLPLKKWRPVPADGLYFKRAHYEIK